MAGGHELANELEAFFRSGNDVSVERATIPAELGLRVVQALRSMEAQIDGLMHDLQHSTDL